MAHKSIEQESKAEASPKKPMQTLPLIERTPDANGKMIQRMSTPKQQKGIIAKGTSNIMCSFIIKI
jgi:hypothetical protein